MNFVELTKRLDRDLYDSCNKGVLQKFARSIERTKGLLGLLKNKDAILYQFPTSYLLKLSKVYRYYESGKQAYKATKRNLAKSRLALPDKSIQNAAFAHELLTLERTARMCTRSGYPDIVAWADAVQAHVDLWNACLKIGKMFGEAKISVADPDHEELVEFSSHITIREKLCDIKGYKWQGARRGERAGALKIEIEVSVPELEDQVRIYMPKLGLAAQKRNISSILEELVLNNLNSTLLNITDKRAEDEAIETACSAYSGLLSSSGLEASKILAVYVNSTTAPVGAVVLNDKGELLKQVEISHVENLTELLSDFLSQNSPDAVVLPVSAGDAERLKIVEDIFSSVSVVKILPMAINEARQKSTLPPMIAGAVVLGLRAINPAKEWSKVEASSLGFGEYSRDIDDKLLSQVLTEAKQIVLLELSKKKVSSFGLGKVATAGVPRKRLNPLVKTIRDLRPGMTVDGIVTNLTRFGAFVNIGLSTEAMVHVSQLSVEFVDEPSQIVKIGQAVSARVLDVVPEKNRIALSLKPEQDDRQIRSTKDPSASAASNALFDKNDNSQQRKYNADHNNKGSSSDSRNRQGQSGSMMHHRGSRKEDKKSRSEALADLDAFFKL